MTGTRRLLASLILALLLPLAASGAAQVAGSELYFAAFGTERLIEWNENDLSREQIREQRLKLSAALDKVLKADARHFEHKQGDYPLSTIYRLLGELSIFEGQPAEAERRFTQASEAARQEGKTEAEVADYARARATALALDGRFDAATALLAATPPCAADRICAPAGLGRGCMFNRQGVLTTDWGIISSGPRGLCVASAFEQSANVATSQSRSDLLEPFLRVAIFAAKKLRFVSVTEAGEIRWRATLQLANWFQQRNREEDRAILIRESRRDADLVAAGGSIFRSYDASVQDTPAAPPPIAVAAETRPAPVNRAALLATIATNRKTLGDILQFAGPMLPRGTDRTHADSHRLASEIYRGQAQSYRALRDLKTAMEQNDMAFEYLPGFIAPIASIERKADARGESCPPRPGDDRFCARWDPDSLSQWANPYVAALVEDRAILEAEAGNPAEALRNDRIGQGILQAWMDRNWADSTDVRAELEQRRGIDHERMTMLARLAAPGAPTAAEARAHAFEAVQLFQYNRVEAAVRSAVARSRIGSSAQREILQQRQKLQEERTRFRTNPATQERLAAQIAALDAQLPFSASEFERQTTFAPLTLASVQASLAGDEAVLVVAQLNDRIEVMAVTSSDSRWVSVPRNGAWVRSRVAKLRRHLDSATGSPGGFDRQVAFELYSDILAPVMQLIGPRLVFASVNGALAEIPLGILVTRSPAGSNTDAAALRNSSWLFEHNVLVSLPSVASLGSLKARRPVRRRDSLVGFGDPPGLPQVSDEVVRAGPDQALAFASAELKELAKARPGARLFMGLDATEANLRSADLGNTTLLAFATHAVASGTARYSEPGLVLAKAGTAGSGADNDGFLSASEVALLRVGADVVVLSACSTASPDVTGGEVLSGLALSFLYAGGQTIMATHWPVVDQAAARLVTGTLSASGKSRPQDIARSLQVQMGELMRSSQDARYADPRIWGPFVVVGG